MQLVEGFKRLVEAPWSPDSSFLPARRFPELSGNSPKAYRQSSPISQQERLALVIKSEEHVKLSNWSRFYKFSVPAPVACPEIANGNILHLSDIHFLKGDPRPLLEVRKLIDYIRDNNIRPDIIALTGDVITKLPDDLCGVALRLLNELSELSPCSLFVHGNHDYHGKVPDYISNQLSKVGFKNLTGEMIEARCGNGKASLYGIDDAYFGSPSAPKSINQSDFNITLVHNLDAIRENFPDQLDLILSGHTHWGELKMPFSKVVKPLNGMWWMERWGYANDLNRHTKHWDQLNDRALSFVHPGLARYYAPKLLAHPPGFVHLTFVPPVKAEVAGDRPPNGRSQKRIAA